MADLPGAHIGESRLRDLYVLTAGEARLAARLMQGRSIDDAATAIGVSDKTARAYLKRIYSKTGVRRQPELVRLLCLALPRSGDFPGDLDPAFVEPPRGPKPRKDGAEAPLVFEERSVQADSHVVTSSALKTRSRPA